MNGTTLESRKELELKLPLPPQSLPELKKIPFFRAIKGQPKRSLEVSVYFDTDTHTLRKERLMLRVRRVGTGTSRRSRPPETRLRSMSGRPRLRGSNRI